MDGEVKIVDFGVAKLAGRVEGHGQLTGTIAYMSPEQAERHPVDHHTDLFSTGLLLYELLTFRRAYDVESPREALALARRAAVPPLPPEVPDPLRQIVERATRPAPEDRFGTAEEMEMALSDFLVRARAARAGETESPVSRLSALMKRLPIDWPEVDLTAEDLDPTEAKSDHDEISGLLEPGDAPDLKLIQKAAETFHSEFLTRVLRDELLAVAGGGRLVPAASDHRAAVALAVDGDRPWLLAEPPTSSEGRRRRRPDRQRQRHLAGQRTAQAGWVVARLAAASLGGAARDAAPASQPSPSPVRAEAAEGNSAGRHRPRFGYLNLNSIPWSEVVIDGRPIGRPTPLLKLKLRAGAHSIVLTNREKKLKKALQVSIRPGGTTWKVVRLK